MLGAIALVFHRHGDEVALAFAFAAVAGSFLVSYTRARAEALGLRGDVGIGSRAERVVVITGRPRARAVGRAAVGDLPADRDGLAHGRPAGAGRPLSAPRTRSGRLHAGVPRRSGQASLGRASANEC